MGPEVPVVTTNSRFRMWWLRVMKGYRIDRRISEPKYGFLGRVVYTHRWYLYSPNANR